MKILDIFAVYGWKAELLARAVSPGGKVYAQNSEAAFARVKDRLEARLKTPAGANIVPVVAAFEDPAPPGMHDFDRVTFFYAHHDITRTGVDRAKMLKALYEQGDTTQPISRHHTAFGSVRRFIAISRERILQQSYVNWLARAAQVHA